MACIVGNNNILLPEHHAQMADTHTDNMSEAVPDKVSVATIYVINMKTCSSISAYRRPSMLLTDVTPFFLGGVFNCQQDRRNKRKRERENL